MRVLIPLASQQKGFFVSLGRRIEKAGHEVSFSARDKDVATLIRRLAPGLSQAMVIETDFVNELPLNEVLSRSLEVESRYNIRLAMCLSYDRALGRGYIFNADRYPTIKRAKWGHERKLSHILRRFAFAEFLLDRHRPDIIMGIQKDDVLAVVAESRGILYLTPSPIKLGTRFLWSDNSFITNTDYLRILSKNVTKKLHELPSVGEYTQEAGSKFNHARIRFTWGGAFQNAVDNIYNECKTLIRGTRKRDSYPLFGWVPSILRRPRNYRFFLSHGIRPEDLRGKRAVYVPLHLEPEIALLALSPEFNNSMEMIAWISKSLPADALVVVKEQPYAFGIRSKRYYQQLMQIGNVVIAHPEVTSWEWIQASAVTATITGTAATEAVSFGRPVLSFGRHQAVNVLPTVRLATEYESTKKGLDELLSLDRADPVFELSRRALHAAQMSCSFEFPGFEKTYASAELQDGLAEMAFEGLVNMVPGLAKPPSNETTRSFESAPENGFAAAVRHEGLIRV